MGCDCDCLGESEREGGMVGGWGFPWLKQMFVCLYETEVEATKE